MPNNNINLVGSYHRPFWFPFASVYVPVTPCVLDGSLSFLEMVWKLLKNLNDVNAATNANHTDILTLESQIEILGNQLDGKLDKFIVNFDLSNMTADKTYTEVNTVYENGIVFGVASFAGASLIALAMNKTATGTIEFYAMNGETELDIIKYTSAGAVQLVQKTVIVSTGGTITGILNITQTPTADNHAANKKYVDDQDAATLAAAKDYADTHDATTLQSAKDYADANFVRTNGDSGNTYASRNTTELNFTDIPASPSTITISNLLAKLSRWYTEIKNKITRAEITNTGGVYKCSMTFADIYALFLEGQEVQLIYDDPLATLEVSIMRTERYGPTSITFVGDSHTCTITSSDVITFS